MTIEIMNATLENGLQVFLKEIHTSPIISHWVWYRVGSRFEVPGKTGISHWVEHMQFKGTPKYPAGNLDRAISRDGGIWNAFTHLDWTTFFETMPAEKIDLSLDLELDRMVNSVYDVAEVESERTVIISEREGSENDPLFKLEESMQQAAFENHPYRNEVIGSKEDLHKIQREDLYSHYQTYYNPANAIIAIAGDFNSTEMLERIRSCYSDVQAKPIPSSGDLMEPPLQAEKRIEVTGPGETTFVELTYRAPAASDDDFFVISVLDSLFTGPSSLNMFGGGGISNKTSRLYRTLVEGELAVGVNGSLQATVDPYLYGITVTVHPDSSPEKVLRSIDDEISRLMENKVTQAEIDRAVKQARALFVYGSENITNQAFWMGYSEMFSHYSWFLNYIEKLKMVSPELLMTKAREYLSPARRVVGIYRPEENPS
ncbi:MAG: pitrilysin family protein [Chloroflexi bacterium]|nr:pitrilysin family protein [Chloroflexota bacterium]